MSSTQSSKFKNKLRKPHGQPSSWEKPVQHQPKGKRQTARGRLAVNSTVVSDVGKDLLDLINSEPDAEPELSQDEEEQMAAVNDVVTDQIDGDHGLDSPNSLDGFASGPSSPQMDSSTRQIPSLGLCSSCRKLFQKAKRMKRSLKDKFQDHDPTSLTCDKWVLKKKWRSRRQCKLEGKLSIDLQSLKKRLDNQQKSEGVWESSCSRPHTFLQRNLRLCTQVLVKQRKKTRGRNKRSRINSQDARLAKRQHQHSFGRHSSLNPSSDFSSNLDLESCSEESTEQSPVHLVPKVTSKQELPAKGSGFKDLLVQLRGKSSMIIKE